MAAEEAPTAVVDDVPEEGESDGDSGFGSDIASSTSSICQSMYEFREIHGRTYHNFHGAKYCMPNDEAAKESLDIWHQMCINMLEGKLYLAPIGDNPQKVIDVGTGTGIWAIDFADQFSSAVVSAIDISPIQPSLVPPNLRFEIDNAELPWTQAPNDFDFIHARGLMGSLSNWPAFYSEAFRTTKSGGWCESVEMDIHIKSDNGSIDEEHILNRWATPFIEYGDKVGRTFAVAGKMAGWMEDAGFDNVIEKTYKIPLGPWSSDQRLKELGRWNLFFYTFDLEGFGLLVLMEQMDWTFEEVMVHIAHVRRALWVRATQAYYEVTVVYGQKPLER